MISMTNQTKTNSSLFIDGFHFVRVSFIDCQLIYQGRDDVDFEDCTFDRVSWTFDDAAERTIKFLATLNQKTGTDGKDLVDAIIASIKGGSVIQAPVSSAFAIAHPATIRT